MNYGLWTKGLICVILVAWGALSLNAQDKGGISLSGIAAEPDSFRGRTIALDLRLKSVDRIFEKITFYDADNRDIEFDISGKDIKNKIRDDLLNIHEGMLYRVTFRVIGAGSLGGIVGELIGFSPVILEQIPE